MTAPLMPDHAPDCAWVLKKNTCSCDRPKYLEAIETVAGHVIAKCVDWTLGDGVGWEDYPDLPEFAWADVIAKVRAFVGYAGDFDEAYDRLSDLATEEA